MTLGGCEPTARRPPPPFVGPSPIFPPSFRSFRATISTRLPPFAPPEQRGAIAAIPGGLGATPAAARGRARAGACGSDDSIAMRESESVLRRRCFLSAGRTRFSLLLHSRISTSDEFLSRLQPPPPRGFCSARPGLFAPTHRKPHGPSRLPARPLSSTSHTFVELLSWRLHMERERPFPFRRAGEP